MKTVFILLVTKTLKKYLIQITPQIFSYQSGNKLDATVALSFVQSESPVTVTRNLLLKSLQPVFGDVSLVNERRGSRQFGFNLRKRVYLFVVTNAVILCPYWLRAVHSKRINRFFSSTKSHAK